MVTMNSLAQRLKFSIFSMTTPTKRPSKLLDGLLADCPPSRKKQYHFIGCTSRWGENGLDKGQRADRCGSSF